MIDYSVSKKINPRNKEEDPKYYANPQVSESVSLEKFARHISDHNSKYNRADVSAVLTQSVDCLREMLLEGKIQDIPHRYEYLRKGCKELLQDDRYWLDLLQGSKVLFHQYICCSDGTM